MPSHPDRVRRNYHDIELKQFTNLQGDTFNYTIHISRHEVASWMSRHEIKREIVRRILKGVDQIDGLK